jgi:hypothetical protein
MKVAPDFESELPLRYFHRIDGGNDIYFVANGDNSPVVVPCTFRVKGKFPSLWDPVSGHIQNPDSFKEIDGRIRMNLTLESHGSIFVVFCPEALGMTEVSKQPNKLETMAEIKGPWQVQFPPNCGAPEMVTMPTLVDWSKHAESGVKYFSGIAHYTARFEVADITEPLYLDLGSVQVMARVKLNGKDLGVLWKPPFRVDVQHAVKKGENILEIAVANLWPNRLIGDAALPAAQRISWTTWNPYQKDSPLLPSGLLGPVTLQGARHH